jgi:hypothetical protein
MTFPNGGAPVVDSIFRTRYSLQCSSSMSDSSGNLLYYANADSIYRVNGTRLPGGVKLFSDIVANGSVFLPVWGEPSKFLMFYLSYNCPNVARCPCVSAIDSVNGIDRVVSNRQLQEYHPLKPLAAKMSAVRDAKGTGWWVFYHGTDDNRYIRFKVDGNVISPLASQTVGTIYTTVGSNPYSETGEITFSPKGDKLLNVSATGIIDVFDFDRCTGQLSNWVPLGTPAPALPGPDVYYGCSFSPDGTKIYVSETYTIPASNRLFQWDLTAPNIPLSKTLIFTAPDSVEMGQHQLGPDGKIYVSQMFNMANPTDSNNFHLAVINDPNQAGLACNFVYQSLWLKGRRSTLNLPNLPNYNLPPLVAQVAEAGPPRKICPGDSVQIGYPDTTNGAVLYSWLPPTGISDQDSGITWAKPTVTTKYYLFATDTAMGAPCGQTIDSVIVTVVGSGEIPVLELGSDTVICASDSVRFTTSSNPNWQYQWSTGDTLASVWVNGAGTYSLTVTNPSANLHCLVASDTVVVATFQTPSALPADFAGLDSTFCSGDSAILGRLGNTNAWEYAWSPSIGLDDASAAQPLWTPAAPGVYTYQVVATDSASAGICFALRDTITLTVEQPFTHPAPEDIRFCIGECFEMGVAPVSGKTYQWSPTTGLTSPTASLTKAQPDATTTYTLTVTDPTLQGVNCRTRQFQVVTTADQCQPASFIIENASGTVQVFANIDHHGPVSLQLTDVTGRLVYRNADYQNELSTSTLSSGLYWYSLQIAGDCPVSLGGVLLVQR